MYVKGNNHKVQFFSDEFLVNKQTFWYDKFWTVFNKKTKNIEIYQVTKMKLLQILPFHNFALWGIEWNQDQSAFLAFDFTQRKYCIIEQI